MPRFPAAHLPAQLEVQQGTSWRDGKLYYFHPQFIEVLKIWPRPRAWRKDAGGSWQHTLSGHFSYTWHQPTTRRLAFADPAQSLFENGGAPPEWQIFRLTRNYRNTRRIAEVLARLDPRAARPDERAPEGEPPEVHVLESPSKLRRQLDDQVDRLVRQGVVPERMAILTPHTRPNSSLNAVTDLGGVPLVDRPDQRDQGLLHTTIGAFKGLEADVVLLADVRPEDPRCSRAVRYVAASRARHRLHVYATGDWLA